MDKGLIELAFLLALTAIMLGWVMIIVMGPHIRRPPFVRLEVVGYSCDYSRTTTRVRSNQLVVDTLDTPFYVYVSNDAVIIDDRYREDLIAQGAFFHVVETTLNDDTRVVRSRLENPIHFNYKYGEY